MPQFNINMPKDLHSDVKIMSALYGITMEKIVINAIADAMKIHKSIKTDKR